MPNSIEMIDGSEGPLLAQNKFLIVESYKEINCDKWKGIITSSVTQSKIKKFDYECFPENDIYYIYAKQKEDKGSKLSPAAIAGIVIGCVVVVGVVVFLLVYFLVIKKKKDNLSSENEVDNENEANEV